LGYDDVKMAITFRNVRTVRMLEKRRKLIERSGARIILTNFKMKDDQLSTSAETVCELDFEVRHKQIFFVCNKW